MLVIGAFVLAVLAAAVVIAGLPLVQRPVTSSPSASSVVSASSVASASSARSSPTVAPEATEPTGDTAWWRFQQGNFGEFGEQTLDLGTLDAGVTASMRLTQQVRDPDGLAFPQRMVIGPREGRIVTIAASGDRNALLAIDATNGDIVPLVETHDVVVDAAFAEGSTVIFLTADSSSGDLTGLWRIDSADPADPVPIEGILAAEAPFRLAARAAPDTRLLVSADGGMAAVLLCQDACVVRAVDLRDGTRFEQPLPFAEIRGLSGQNLVMVRTEQGPIGNGVLLNLASGETVELPGDGWQTNSEAIVPSNRGPLLIAQETGMVAPAPEPLEDPSFSAIELDALVAHEPIFPDGLGSMRIIAVPGYDMGVELPTGWFAVLGNAPVPADGAAGVPMTVFAIEASTGRVVALPAMGEVFIQG